MTRRMRTSRAGIELIKSFEGFRPRAVKLGEGRYLVGYGHTKTARAGVTISDADATLMLREYDLPPIERALASWVLSPLSQNEFDALVSFVFNIGMKAFRESAVLSLLNSGEKLAAAEAMSAWRKARMDGKLIVVDALVRRRAVEKALFLEHPSGRPTVPTALVRPHLDLGIETPVKSVAAIKPRPKPAPKPAPAAETKPAPVKPKPETRETAEPERAPVRRGKIIEVPEVSAPEQAVRQVGERLTRILGDAPETEAASSTSREPTIEEITAAVSALAEPSDAGELTPRPEQPEPVDPKKGANGSARHVDVDDLEPAETMMERIEKEEALRRNGNYRSTENSAKRGTWWAMAIGGLVAMGWGVADRLGWMPGALTMTERALDAVPPLLVLGGLVLTGMALWNLAGSRD